MSQRRKTKSNKKTLLVSSVGLALVICGLVVRQSLDRSHEVETGTVEAANSDVSDVTELASTDGSAEAQDPDAPSGAERIDRDLMLRQLKVWIKKREGHEVEIVSSQDVQDLYGNAVSMNVTVSSRLNGVVTAQKVAEELAELNKREEFIRSQLNDAYHAKDISEVNRLVAELRQGREKFVKDLEVSTFKLSLVRDLPPVLAYWPGLGHEMIKEEAARSIASANLGAGTKLQGLVSYSSVTALLHFVNDREESVYIDPFNMVEVSLTGLKSVDLKAADNGDKEKESRIEKQWLEYL